MKEKIGTHERMKNVICILVLYNPDIDLLRKVISPIISQIDLLWISDNSIETIDLTCVLSTPSKILYEKMPGNIGIAAAQNYGIRYAIEHQFQYVFLLDQDSISPCNMILSLISQYEYLCSSNIKVGAIGPRAFNSYENKDYRGTIKKGKKIESDITEVSELISSASLMEVATFKKVGLMDELLFIDGVDYEWCWRAKAKELYRFFVIESVKLNHRLGEGDRSFFGKKISIPTPFRTYYLFRNYFILLRYSYVPLYWKVAGGVKYAIKMLYFPLCVSPRMGYLKNIWRGIFHGVSFYHK